MIVESLRQWLLQLQQKKNVLFFTWYCWWRLWCRGTRKASVHSDGISVIMQQGYQKPQAFFTIFRCWDRDWTYLSKKRNFREARQFFGKKLFAHYIDQALESDGEELVDYVLCQGMFPVTKRNLKKYPQQKGELLCRTQHKFLNLRKTSYPSDQVSDYNESWSCKNWRPSSLFLLYVRINIRIASHFTQGTWRESQTSYPNFKSLHCRVKQRQV